MSSWLSTACFVLGRFIDGEHLTNTIQQVFQVFAHLLLVLQIQIDHSNVVRKGSAVQLESGCLRCSVSLQIVGCTLQPPAV